MSSLDPRPEVPRDRPDPASRLAGWLVGALGAYVVVIAVLAAQPSSAGSARVTFAESFAVVSSLTTAWLAWRASRRKELDPHLRSAWRWLAAAYASQWLGDVLWFEASVLRGADAVRSWGVIPYFAFYPLVLVAIARVPLRLESRGDRVRFVLDVATVGTAGAILVWYLATPASQGDLPLGELVLTTGYAIGDVVLLMAAASIWLAGRAGSPRSALSMVAIALIAMFAGDLLFARAEQSGSYEGGGVASVCYASSYFLTALAAHLRRVPGAEALGRARPVLGGALPYAAVGFALAPLLLAAHAEASQPLRGLVFGVVCLLTLAVARQILAERDSLRLAAESSARDGRARLSALITHSSDVIMILDQDSTVRYVSPSCASVFGLEPETLLARPLADRVHPDDEAQTRRFLASVAGLAQGSLSEEWRFRHRDGAWRYVENVGTNLLEEPAVRGLVLNVRDVTDRQLLEQRLMHQAFHDPLTQLANRALFLDRVSHAFERTARSRESVAVLFLDLDNFKVINDTLGHAAGDRLLVAAAERLAACVRTGDTIARLGGDEFGILVEDVDGLGGADAVAQRVLDAFGRPFVVEGRELVVGASIGIASATDAGSPDEFLRNADVAMYMAKGRGRGRSARFERQMHAAVRERMELEAELRHAIEAGELRVYYQPIVHLGSGEVAGFEALVRWQHPRRGLIAPGSFIPIAEETGLVVPIGAFVLREACRQVSAWRGELGRALHLGVNVSARHLQEPAVLEHVGEALARSGFPPDALMIEMTESAVVQQSESFLGRLRELKTLGVGLALDDFGTGYSSLSHLQRFPVDILKIDKSFIDRLGGAGEDSIFARAIVSLGESLDILTVAEGIERPEQLEALRSLGCVFGQGYHFARPAPAEEVGAMLRARRGARAAEVAAAARG